MTSTSSLMKTVRDKSLVCEGCCQSGNLANGKKGKLPSCSVQGGPSRSVPYRYRYLGYRYRYRVWCLVPGIIRHLHVPLHQCVVHCTLCLMMYRGGHEVPTCTHHISVHQEYLRACIHTRVYRQTTDESVGTMYRDSQLLVYRGVSIGTCTRDPSPC